MAIFLSSLGYVLLIVLNLMAFILILEWLFYSLPGSAFNGIRKILFRVSYPFLSWGERFFTIRWASFNSRGLLTALLLWTMSYLGVPWLILYGYFLRGQ